MNSFFVDLHIHLGATKTGRPVKITASKNMTLSNVLTEAADIKGLQMVGIIDCHVPEVIAELEMLLKEGVLEEYREGGLVYKNDLCLILGSEIEVYDQNSKGPIHVLVYFPFLCTMKLFSAWLKERVTNITLSTQRMYEDGITLQKKVKELSGLFIPAHVFTPFKSLYGRGVENTLAEVFDPSLIDGIELGLSSDTTMAMKVAELQPFSFLTNSDAHSLANIAREYQKMKMAQPTFSELQKVLKNKNGRKIESNYGLNPLLGKYYETTCEKCFHIIDQGTRETCPNCGHSTFIKGVSKRIMELASLTCAFNEQHRPPYIHQVPLQFIPTLGPKTIQKLRNKFQTEMEIIHSATKEDLETIVSPKIADYILKARSGQLSFYTGGGGRYGKVK